MLASEPRRAWKRAGVVALRYGAAVLAGIALFCIVFNWLTTPVQKEPEKATDTGSFTIAAGVKTHYLKEGKGDISVLLLHGFGGSTYSWRMVMKDLAKEFTVFAVDMRGFGYTARDPAAEYTPRGYATHVMSFMDQLGIRRPVIVGHSMGGEVAMRVALQRPDDVAGIVLIDSTGVHPVQSGTYMPPVAGTTALRVGTSPGIMKRILTSAFYDEAVVDDEMVQAYRDPFQVERAEMALKRMIQTSQPVLNRSDISRINQPVLILWGREDTWIRVSEGRELAGLIKGSRLIVYERAGHMLLEERWFDVVNQVTAFTKVVGEPLPGQTKPVTPPPSGSDVASFPASGGTPTPGATAQATPAQRQPQR